MTSREWAIRGDIPHRSAHSRPLSHPLGMLVDVDVRRDLNRIAMAQHSLITLEQAQRAGLSVGQIRHKVRSGEWVVPRPRVYAVASASATWAQAVASAALSLQPRAWVSHETAGRFWGFELPYVEAIDVLVGLGRRVKQAGVRSHRSGALFSADLSRHLRIPVTTPERTLVDLSGSVAAPALGRMLDDGLRRRLIRLERLGSCVGRVAKCPGRRPAVIHDLLADRLPGYDPGTATWRPGCCASWWRPASTLLSSSTG